MGIITLTTDFGLRDNFVGMMKGVIYGINSEARLIDISHELPAHDIGQAAFCLFTAYAYFPSGTVHLAVVDPGVGSEREMIAVKAGGHVFVAPNNGLLGYIFDREPEYQAYFIKNSELFSPQTSRTFHGRDIMAPVAAHLSSGLPLNRVGPPADKVVKLLSPGMEEHPNAIYGRIVYADRFGNLITNVPNDLISDRNPASIVVKAGPVVITGVAGAYSDAAIGEYLAIPGSAGFLEIARNMAPAQQPPDLTVGVPVEVRPPPDNNQ